MSIVSRWLACLTRSSGPNDIGNSYKFNQFQDLYTWANFGLTCSNVFTTWCPSLLNMKTGISSPQNSLMNWRHIPHGLAGSVAFVATANALNAPARRPEDIAVPMATRSAQVPTGYAAFSTLAPEIVLPVVVGFTSSSVAPTWKLLYGAIGGLAPGSRWRLSGKRSYHMLLSLLQLILWRGAGVPRLSDHGDCLLMAVKSSWSTNRWNGQTNCLSLIWLIFWVEWLIH